MNLREALNQLHEDRAIVEPFADLLLRRAREKLGKPLQLEDIELKIVILDRQSSPGSQALVEAGHQLLTDLTHESVGL